MKQSQNNKSAVFLILKGFSVVCICLGIGVGAYVYMKGGPVPRDSKAHAKLHSKKLPAKPKSLSASSFTPIASPSGVSQKANRAPARRYEKGQDLSKRPPKRHPKQELSFRELKALQAKSYREDSRDEEYDFKNESGDAYALSADLAAVRKSPSNEGVYPGAPMVNGYYIVDRLAVAGEGEVRDVVQNKNTKKAAVFTGQIKVKLREFAYERDFEHIYGCEIALRYEHISSLLCRFDTYQEALAALNQMKKDPGVKRANLEILEYERQGR